MDKLRDPWVFAGSSSALISIVTYVWAQLTDKNNSAQQAGGAFIISLFSLLLLTWIAHSQSGSVMVEPFPS